MTKDELKKILSQFKQGKLSEQQIVERFAMMQTEPIGYASIDHHRELRQGFPEVILCQGKTATQVAEIAARIARGGHPLLATRATRDQFKAVKRKVRGRDIMRPGRVITANEQKSINANRVDLIVTAVPPTFPSLKKRRSPR
jgi:NCAIR mutase (PurE)-related protein